MKIKVLQVGKFYFPYRGGMETYLFNLCQGLKDRVDLEVLVSNTSPRTVREKIEGVEVIRAGRWGRVSNTSACPSFPLLLKKHAGDIVQIQHPDPLAGISYLLGRPRGKLIIVYQSDIIRKRLVYAYLPFLNRFFQKADRVIASSPQYLESSWFLKKFREKCTVIPIGIDLALFRLTPAGEEKVRRIRSAHGDKLVLFVGRLSLYKGIDYLIEAMEGLDARLLVAGGGERFRALKYLTGKRRLTDKVVFLGKVTEEELIAYYHACSVFCLPSVSRNEAFGIVQLEAMACSRPVVSTDLNTGVNYINQDGVTGFLVPPRDPRALGEALGRILDDAELGRRLGAQGRQRAEALFTRERMAEKTLLLYRELLGGG